MSRFLDFGNLFQRPLLPIGQRDKDELEEIYPGSNGNVQGFTHWLIALMWCEDVMCAGWEVIVFPVAEGRVFWLVPPLFRTAVPSTFENAWKLSEAILLCSCNDELTEKFVHPYWDDWDKL